MTEESTEDVGSRFQGKTAQAKRPHRTRQFLLRHSYTHQPRIPQRRRPQHRTDLPDLLEQLYNTAYRNRSETRTAAERRSHIEREVSSSAGQPVHLSDLFSSELTSSLSARFPAYPGRSLHHLPTTSASSSDPEMREREELGSRRATGQWVMHRFSQLERGELSPGIYSRLLRVVRWFAFRNRDVPPERLYTDLGLSLIRRIYSFTRTPYPTNTHLLYNRLVDSIGHDLDEVKNLLASDTIITDFSAPGDESHGPDLSTDVPEGVRITPAQFLYLAREFYRIIRTNVNQGYPGLLNKKQNEYIYKTWSYFNQLNRTEIGQGPIPDDFDDTLLDSIRQMTERLLFADIRSTPPTTAGEPSFSPQTGKQQEVQQWRMHRKSQEMQPPRILSPGTRMQRRESGATMAIKVSDYAKTETAPMFKEDPKLSCPLRESSSIAENLSLENYMREYLIHVLQEIEHSNISIAATAAAIVDFMRIHGVPLNRLQLYRKAFASRDVGILAQLLPAILTEIAHQKQRPTPAREDPTPATSQCRTPKLSPQAPPKIPLLRGLPSSSGWLTGENTAGEFIPSNE